MMMISMLKNIVRPYSAVESWIYDQLVGPVLATFFEELLPDLSDVLEHGGRLLDVGCGGGHISRMIADWNRQVEVMGLDLSPEQIARARKAARGYGERLTYVEGTALELPFERASFDAVISIGSIKHWPDRDRGLAECVRVLQPGGMLIVTETDRSCHFDDMNRFIERLAVPGPLRTPLRMIYRTYVAGQSIDLLEARELAGRLQGLELAVERTNNGGLKLWGRKPAEAT
jgi:ubiquinone/menaquinone biosynthesis C-methylase UbiE